MGNAKNFVDAMCIATSIYKETHEDPPYDFVYDVESSESAGYPILRNMCEHDDYVCDLGDHLEINFKDRNCTINLWYQD